MALSNTLPMQRFRFLDLPAKLRNAIYELIATETTITIKALDTDLTSGWPGICFVNRQIRKECMPILYRTVKFESHISDMDFTHVIRFLQEMPTRYRKALSQNKSFVLDFNWYSASRKAEADLMAWIDYRANQLVSGEAASNIHYRLARVPLQPPYARWIGDAYLSNMGYTELERLQSEAKDRNSFGVVTALMTAMWKWAHPDLAVPETTYQSGKSSGQFLRRQLGAKALGSAT